MMPTFQCSGEYRAHKAGEEAPCCWLCDAEVQDFDFDGKAKYTTTRGKPICKTCHDDVEDRVKANRAYALAAILDPRETRASNLLRQNRPNIHD